MRRIVFLLIVFAFMLKISSAAIVGVSPANVEFKNVLRGGYAEKALTMGVDSDQKVYVEVEALGDIKEWLDFTQNLSISKNNPGRIIVSVRPPSDMPNGNYTGFLRIWTDPLGEADGSVVSVVRAVLDVAITVSVTDNEISQCTAENFLVKSAEKGEDVVFNVDVINDGNIRLRPNIIINIWDQDQISVLDSVEYKGSEILPTRKETLSFNLATNNLKLDQYWAEVQVIDCISKETLTFDVLEEGALKAEGILLKIFSVAEIEVDKTVPIYALFSNTGEKDVIANFKGQITLDGEVVQLLTSEKETVKIGETNNFTFFFTPKKAGKYVASGRVFYDKKRTFELSTILYAFPKVFGIRQIFFILIYLAIGSSILFLFYKVRNERKRYLNRFRVLRGQYEM